MLLSKTVVQKWHNRNKKYYENLGYVFTKYGDEFIIDIVHLSKGSHIEVEVLCDYCNNIVYKIPYSKYYSNMNRDKVNKNACGECALLKRVDGFNYNDRKSKGYWDDKNNRLVELKKYIDNGGSFEDIYNKHEGHNLMVQFKRYNHDINKAIEEIGYDVVQINYKPREYYSDLENLAELIRPLISKYNRFPTYSEISQELGTNFKAINSKESLAEIKKILKYDDTGDLVDDSGFLNRSSYEYIVAQFLIGNNINYKREQLPFPSCEGNYKSDFTFYLDSGAIVHLEVWGIGKNEKQHLYDNYKSIMDYKKTLYEKYKIPLISIYRDVFYKSYSAIQNELTSLLEPILDKKLKYVNQEKLIPYTYMDDEKLLDEIIRYSEDGIVFPTYKEMERLGKRGLYGAVLKRYNTLYDFAQKYGKVARLPNGYKVE